MYTIVMNDKKELITTKYATLYQKEKLADQIQFIYPQTCGLVDLSECIAVLKYIDIGNEAHSEILSKDSEPYKETKVRAVLPVDTELNRFAGNVSVRLVFMKMNPESMQLEQKMMSGNVIITIEPVDAITESTEADSALQKEDITTGSANGTIAVDGTDVEVKGLGSAAYADTTAFDAAGVAEEKVNTLANGAVADNTAAIAAINNVETGILKQAKAYVDTEIANLVNSAPETLDTLGELATAFEENQDVVEALNTAITEKASKDELTEVEKKSVMLVTMTTGDSENFVVDKTFEEVYSHVANGGTAVLYDAVGVFPMTYLYCALADADNYVMFMNTLVDVSDFETYISYYPQGVFSYGIILSNDNTVSVKKSNFDLLTTEINALNTNSKTVTGAINEVNAKALTQSDWSVNDESDVAFIKNKPFYTGDPVETFIVEETTFELVDGREQLTSTHPLEVGQEYTVTLDGATYNCVAKLNEEFSLPYIGNAVLVGGEDTGESFFIAPMQLPTDLNFGIMINSDIAEHTVSIVCMISEIHHIDPKYIKDMYYENTEYILKTSSDIDEILTNMGYDPFAGTRSPKKVNGLTFSVAVDGVIYDDVTVYIDGYIAGCNTYIIGDRCVTSPDGIRWDTTDYGFAYSRYGTQYNSDIFPNGIEKIEVYELKRDLKQLDMKYLPIMEEVSNTVVEIDEIESGLEIADPSYKKLVGKYKVTVDGEFEIVKFIGDDVESFYECDSYLIGTWDGGIYFEYFSENENPHSLKIEKIKNVVKEEHLPDVVNDWNTLKNKPFYDDREIAMKMTLTKNGSDNYVFKDSGNYDTITAFTTMIDESEASNSIVIVEINSVLYEMYPHSYSGVHYLGFNESGITDDWVIYNNMAGNNGMKIILSIGTSNNYSSGISVSGDSVDVTFYTKYSLKQLDEKYIPNSIKESIGKKAGLKVEGTVYTIDGEEITASIGAEIFNDYENNIATGTYSSAKGHKTVALGTSSYAEGRDTKAISAITHAEGYGTIASGLHQHVQGEYNIEDTEDKYAHIVGNGTADSARSNAHTLDWQGNAWYQGSVEATAIILKSPNGTRFSITIGDDGVLSATEITE